MADKVQTVKTKPGNKWVRSLVEKKCQFVAAGLHRAYQNANAAPLFRQGSSSRTLLAQGPLHYLVTARKGAGTGGSCGQG